MEGNRSEKSRTVATRPVTVGTREGDGSTGRGDRSDVGRSYESWTALPPCRTCEGGTVSEGGHE